MIPARKSIQTAAVLALAGLFSVAGADAYAASGTVTQLSGNLYARTDKGTPKILSEQSTVEPGDVLITGNAAYARIHFVDGSEVVLGPDTKMRVESFSVDEASLQNASATFSLSKGEMRYSAGTSQGSSIERAQVITPSGTIQIGAATVIVGYTPMSKAAPSHAARSLVILADVDPSLVDYPGHVAMSDAGDELFSARDLVPYQLAQNLTPPTPSGARAPGLYVQVLDGMIHLTNGGGSQSFTAGQFGYTASFVQPPVVLPANPGMQFTPPPSFSSSTNTQSGGSGKSGTVDCEVR
jgi:hypothetical protein